MKKQIVISDPFPRTLDLIFTKEKIKELKNKYKIITVPKKNKKKFYENNIDKATFILGQPDLNKKILSKAKKLKAIINVESNFMNNVDYKYCFKKKNTCNCNISGILKASGRNCIRHDIVFAKKHP
tara:strand:- start:451 stop:828 length:378 start_codon:yes stop_codon:yes gene_type:complete